MVQAVDDQIALTRGRTDYFSTKNSINNQLEPQHSIQRIPVPCHTEIGTLSWLPPFSRALP